MLSVTTFTTDDPTAEFFRAADWIHREGTQPTLMDLGAPAVGPSYTTLRGHYGPNLVFQRGESPYSAQGSGDFETGPDGTPRQQRTEPIRFALTLPLTPMPEGGYPIAIYAHGTGGDYQSFIRDRTAEALAAQGVAVLGFGAEGRAACRRRRPARRSPLRARAAWARPRAKYSPAQWFQTWRRAYQTPTPRWT